MTEQTTPPPMSNARFAAIASRIAQRAAHWSADTLMMDDLDCRIAAETARRFAAEIRPLLDRMEEEARG